MVDVVEENIPAKKSIMNEIEKIIENGSFINGPIVESFAIDLCNYLNIKHVIPCANGTDALLIALMAIGLKEGDEVITPSFTFASVCEVLSLLKVRIVFVDVELSTFNIDSDKIEELITEKTKAIIPVHLFGQAANMEKIQAVAEKHGISIIEDNSQALGSDFIFKNGAKQKTGTIGEIGTVSFYPTKNLGGLGDGGAVFTNSDSLADKIRMITNHGQAKRYSHDLLGMNSRLDSIQAAALKIKLNNLNSYVLARRNSAQLYNSYLSNLNGIFVPFEVDYSYHTYNQYTIRINSELNRDSLVESLTKHGIPYMIYYPIPLHRQTFLRNTDFTYKDLSNTENLSDNVLSLPMHSSLSPENIQLISNCITEWARG